MRDEYKFGLFCRNSKIAYNVNKNHENFHHKQSKSRNKTKKAELAVMLIRYAFPR